jgi:hypothetical protein
VVSIRAGLESGRFGLSVYGRDFVSTYGSLVRLGPCVPGHIDGAAGLDGGREGSGGGTAVADDVAG